MFFIKASIFVLLTFEHPFARAKHQIEFWSLALNLPRLSYCLSWFFPKLFKQLAWSQTLASLLKLFQENKYLIAFPCIWSGNPLILLLQEQVKLKNPVGYHLIQFG